MKLKCVIVVSRDLPAGMKANAAAILGITLGKNRPDLVGSDPVLPEGQALKGIIQIPIPVLQAETERVSQLAECSDYVFTDIAQRSRTYEEYLRLQREDSGKPLAVLLIGPEKKIRKLTGDLPLMG